jgi:hypothetical protein
MEDAMNNWFHTNDLVDPDDDEGPNMGAEHGVRPYLGLGCN